MRPEEIEIGKTYKVTHPIGGTITILNIVPLEVEYGEWNCIIFKTNDISTLDEYEA